MLQSLQHVQTAIVCALYPPSLRGVNDIIKEHAVLLQEATGFRCLLPDLYKGKIGVDKEEAHHVSTLHLTKRHCHTQRQQRGCVDTSIAFQTKPTNSLRLFACS